MSTRRGIITTALAVAPAIGALGQATDLTGGPALDPIERAVDRISRDGPGGLQAVAEDLGISITGAGIKPYPAQMWRL